MWPLRQLQILKATITQAERGPYWQYITSCAQHKKKYTTWANGAQQRRLRLYHNTREKNSDKKGKQLQQQAEEFDG